MTMTARTKIAVVVSLLVLAAAAGSGLPAAEPAPRWELVWSDEFDYEGALDPEKWRPEVGFVRNREAQYYTRDRRENARVENGRLIIEGRREHWPNPAYQPGASQWQRQREFAEYTSASLTTEGRFAFRYGRVEVRAKLPRGQGVWPAIWTLGENIREIGWPRCGEIDIMEFVGHTPDQVHANIHYGAGGQHRSRAGRLTVPSPCDDFHIYAMEWVPDRIDFYFDQRKYHTVPLDIAGAGEDNAFRRPHYLLINLALGGSWGREIDDRILPQQYVIDYVRIYRQRDERH
jgi:beta-glucanase (GH16 family)